VRFRFPVTWSTLLDASALRAPDDQARVLTPEEASRNSGVEWAMVIPKLAPQANGPVGLLPAIDSDWRPTFAAPKYVIPKFEVSSGAFSLAVKFLLSVSATLLLVPGWKNTGSPGARAVEMESSMRESGWAREAAGHERQLVLYRASLGATDYRLDFTWRISTPGITCVFRAKDGNNFYAVHIQPVGSESSRAFSIERFAQLRGVEKPRVRRVLTAPGKSPSLGAAVDVSGSLFRLYLGGTLVSQWNESRLNSGGLGFLEEGRQPVGVQAARISFPRK
jgi:hypothetical protein